MYIEKLVSKEVDRSVTFTIPFFDSIPLAKSLPSDQDLTFYLNVTKVEGTDTPQIIIAPAAVLSFQKADQSFFELPSFSNITATGKSFHLIQNCPRILEMSVSILGTNPVFSFDLWLVR